MLAGGGNWTTLPAHGYMAGTSFTCAIRSSQALACWVRRGAGLIGKDTTILHQRAKGAVMA